MMEYWNTGKTGKIGKMDRKKEWEKEMVFDLFFGLTHHSIIPAFQFSRILPILPLFQYSIIPVSFYLLAGDEGTVVIVCFQK